MDPPGYAKRVQRLEKEGLTTSDAQGAADVEFAAQLKALRQGTWFQKSIIRKKLVPAGVDPRHLEGFIRLQYGTLGHLGWPDIKREIKIGLVCIKEGGVEAAESNAQSFGL
jgi:hypothetical protein